MARDITYPGTASELVPITRYMSGFNITETGASTAYVKLRDAIPLPTGTLSAVDAAAGNVTTGLHMLAMTYVTRHGESLQGSTGTEFTAAGSKIATVTIPIGPTTLDVRTGGAASGLAPIQDIIVGRRIYVTKAGAPATTVTPTNAQWFLILADLSTTLAAGMNNLPLAGNTSITVASTSGFGATGNALVTTTTGVQPVAYTSVDATHLLGVTMLRPAYTGGFMATGNAVTQPMVGNNTATTYSWNVADGSLAATNPPTKDTAGRRLKTIKLTSGEAVGDDMGANVLAVGNTGGVYVEVNSGTVEWTVSGQ